jgi:hypothetical protein
VLDFEGVACVQRDDGPPLVVVAPVQPALDGAGIDGRRAACLRLNRRMVHADDFALDFHTQLSKWRRGGPAFPRFECSKPRIGLKLAQEAADRFRRSGQEQVDAFACQQDGANETQGSALRGQQVPQRAGVLQGHETVGGNIQHGIHRGRF